MSRLGLVVLIAAVVALGSFGASYYVGRSCCALHSAGNEMEWLRSAYHLNQSQFDKIKALQEGYRPTCDRLCQRISEANSKLDRLIQTSQSVTPDIEAALKQSSEVREDCRKAMLGHIYQVAAEMSPGDRERYLQLMKTRIIMPPMGHPDSSMPAPIHSHSETCPQ